MVLLEMLTGRLPFAGENHHAIRYGIVNGQAEPVTTLRSGLPVELGRIVAKTYAKSPQERYQHASDLIADLRKAAGPRQISRRQPTALTRRRRRWAYVLAAAFALAVSGFLTWRSLGPQQAVNSIVILPLRPLSQDATESFLGLGIADALIMKSARPAGYKSGQRMQFANMPRRTAIRWKPPAASAPRRWSGSFQQSGDRIRVSVQLLRTATGETIWAQSFRHDPMLDPVRNDPGIAQFRHSLKTTWESNQRELSDEEP